MSAELCRGFAELHSLLKQLEDAEQLLLHGPRRVAHSQKKIQQAELACAEQKEVIKQLRKKADQQAMTLKSHEAEVTKLTLQLNEASSNKQYDIIQGQINSKKSSDAILEDEILQLLSDVDDATEEQHQNEQKLAELQQETLRIQADVDSREPGLKADVERLTQEIATAEKIIKSGVDRSTYHRLRAAQGASALSCLEDGYCEACNTQATPQDTVQINMGEFLLCRACGRILYRIHEE